MTINLSDDPPVSLAAAEQEMAELQAWGQQYAEMEQHANTYAEMQQQATALNGRAAFLKGWLAAQPVP